MSKETFLLLLLILALGAFFRFYQITEIPPGLYPDEAMNGNNALEALATGDFKVFYPENNGREGLFINLQAISLWLFGNKPWALRVVSAVFGTLAILGLYLMTKELLKNPAVALLSSFFLATSFWHVNFSRIGFRGIMIPLFATFGMYFLLKGLRRGKISDLVFAGIFAGLGFYTYIAFRFMPFVLLMPIIWYLWRWKKKEIVHCIPCVALLFIFVALAIALPLGFYFLQNTHDFLGRTGDVSIFSSVSPLKEFIKSNLATLSMFFSRGDCNWRHNFNCQPQLNSLIGLFFAIGIAVLARNATSYKLQATTLLAWLFFMSLPATLTREGIPHALRSIGLIPPVMILSGFGAWWIYQKAIGWLDKRKSKWPNSIDQLVRIKREVLILSALVLLLIPVLTYRQYFVLWASNENTYFAFATGQRHLGEFLASLPQETKKIVVMEDPISVQTVMFITDTYRPEERRKKNIIYLTSADQLEIPRSPEKTIIAFINSEDEKLILSLRQKFSELKIRVPGDFVILETR